MPSCRYSEEDYKENASQVVKKSDKSYRTKLTLKDKSDYDLFDEEIKGEFDKLYNQQQ